MEETNVVAAVMTASSSRDHNLAQRIEQAMTQAVYDCLESGVGIYETDKIIAAKMEARQRVLDEARKPVDPTE